MNLEVDGTKKILLTEENQGLTLQTDTKEIAVAIGGVSVQGPQGDKGSSGVVNVTAPITNSGTYGEANIGIIVGSAGGVADYNATQTALASKLNSSTAASTYLTINNAASTYLTQTSASGTYLTQSDASSNYLTIINAANIYLTQSSASATYAPLASAIIKTPTSSQIIANGTNGIVPLSINQSAQSHAFQTTLNATSGADITALNVVSHNPDSSAVWISGKEYGHGTLKVAHLQPEANSDANAAALSINLASNATRAADVLTDDRTATQGIFIDSYQTPSTGLKVNIVNGSNVITLANDNVNPISNTAIDKYIICTGFTSNTKILSINNNEITLSNSCTAITQNGIYAAIRYGSKGKILYFRNGGNDKLILTADGQLQLPATNDAQPNARGITIGGDTNLYRNGANELKTDDNFTIGQGLQIGSDVNLYRSGANSLTADSSFTTTGDITTGDELRFVDSNTKFYRSSTNPYTIRTNNQLYLFNDSNTFSGLSLNWGTPNGYAAFTIRNDGKLEWAPGNNGGAKDTNLYRNTSGNELKTDGNFTIGETLQIGSDTNLYRSNANELKTDDSLVVSNDITTISGNIITNNELRFVDSDTKFYRSSTNPYTIRTNNQLYLFNDSQTFNGLALNWGNANGSAAFTIRNDGRLEWGPGNNGGSRDVYLYRNAANSLTVSGKLQVTTAPTTNNDVVRKTDLSAYTPLTDTRLTAQNQATASVRSISGSDGVTNGTAITVASSDHSHNTINNDLSLAGHKITNVATPIADTDVARKIDVDNAASGLNVKEPVAVATISALTITAATSSSITVSNTSVDGVNLSTLTSGTSRILVKDQPTSGTYTEKYNGIYVYNSSGTWNRATDASTWATPTATAIKGAYTLILGGTQVNSGFLFSAAAAGTIGTDPITFAKFTTVSNVTAGYGLEKVGDQINAKAGDGISIDATANSLINIKLKSNNGIAVDSNGIYVNRKTGGGIAVDANGLYISGDFSAGTITANLIGSVTGNASTATALLTARAINGTNFDGTQDITITANTTNQLTISTGLALDSGTTFNGSAAKTLTIDNTVATLTGAQTLTNKTLTSPKISGSSTGATTIGSANSSATNYTITLPARTGTVITDQDSGTVNNTMLAGSIANNKLANSTISGISLGGTLAALSQGTGISSFSYTGANTATVAVDTNKIPTISTSAYTITFTPSSSTTVTLPTGSTSTLARTDAGQTFTGVNVFTSPNISGTGTSITNIGTFALRDTSAAYDVTIAASSSTALTAGRTLTIDMLNGSRTIKLAGNIDIGGNITTASSFTTSGSGTLTLTTINNTNVTLPTTGTLATLAGAEAFINKTSYNKVAITAPANGSTLTIVDGKTLTVNKSIVLDGTDSTTMTFPSTSATIARTDAGQTFTGVNTFTSPSITTSITSSSATFTAFTGPTTFDIGAGATSGTFGYTGTAASTTNISTGVVANAVTKTINIGTAGASGSTTNVNVGSAVSGANNTITLNGGTRFSIVNKTGAYTATTSDYTILCDGTFTVNLPSVTATTNGLLYNIKNVGTGTITIDPNSTETIDGLTVYTLNVRYQSVTVQAFWNGTVGVWYIL